MKALGSTWPSPVSSLSLSFCLSLMWEVYIRLKAMRGGERALSVFCWWEMGWNLRNLTLFPLSPVMPSWLRAFEVPLTSGGLFSNQSLSYTGCQHELSAWSKSKCISFIQNTLHCKRYTTFISPQTDIIHRAKKKNNNNKISILVLFFSKKRHLKLRSAKKM